jgi:hypothetical protein
MMGIIGSRISDSENATNYTDRNYFETILRGRGIDVNDAGVKAILDAQEKEGQYNLAKFKNTYMS